MRAPAVSGQFYPRNKNDLDREISRCFDGVQAGEKPVLGAVVPHAGYIYSGNTAAHVYSMLPEADTFVLLGPNHTGYGSPVSVSSEKWSTPLGEVDSDIEFIKALPRRIIDTDETAHKYEHSIEVQLPFLQHRFRDFKIVPICMGMQDEETALDVGMELAEAVRKVNKKIVIIASSDFSHYKPDKVAREDDAYFINRYLILIFQAFIGNCMSAMLQYADMDQLQQCLRPQRRLVQKKQHCSNTVRAGILRGILPQLLDMRGL